ncbi:MAG TPA: HisA/HisF-related TIM barrel protein [Methanothrix sp.]|nr:HisA/HisF-related TIM barrel protein [Methanothrix sp.]
MRCIFVLDILNGAVVHALRGERKNYRPIDEFSSVVSTSDPALIMQELRPREVYVADLNQITGEGDSLEAIKEISRRAKTMADIGVSSLADLDRLPPAVSPVLGTETASISLIKEAAGRSFQSWGKALVSIDLKKGRLLSSDPGLAGREPIDLLKRLNHLDLEAVIILDLDRVGASAGLDRPLLEAATEASDHPLILGGGVRGEKDLADLEEMGFAGALVATAVHNGRIPLSKIR